MIKAIIFDCFGVLATEAWLPFKARYFGHDRELFEQASYIARQANRGLISQSDFIDKVAKLAKISPQEAGQFIGQNVPDETLFTYLQELKSHYKLGFLSNIAGNYLNQIFTPGQIALFDVIELSYQSGFIKPEPEAYRQMAQRLNVEPGECVLVDDQERNVTGGREAGMLAILYHDAGQFRQELAKLLTA